MEYQRQRYTLITLLGIIEGRRTVQSLLHPLGNIFMICGTFMVLDPTTTYWWGSLMANEEEYLVVGFHNYTNLSIIQIGKIPRP